MLFGIPEKLARPKTMFNILFGAPAWAAPKLPKNRLARNACFNEH
jgi:hypothetical protein